MFKNHYPFSTHEKRLNSIPSVQYKVKIPHFKFKMQESWSKNNKYFITRSLFMQDDSETSDNNTFAEIFVGTLDNTSSTDWSNDLHAISSDISYDYEVPEDHVSCTSIVDEFNILCVSSVDNHQSSYDLHDIWQTLKASKGKEEGCLL